MQASAHTNLVMNYLEAVGNKQFEAVSSLLHPNLEFRLGAQVFTKDSVLMALKQLEPIHLRSEIRQLFNDGDTVCAVYDFVTDTPVGPVPSVEWISVEDGLIRTAHLIFEKERWPEVLEELRRRTGMS